LTKKHPDWIDGAEILHFGAERCFVPEYKSRASRYVMADAVPTREETQVDIQKIQYPDNTFDTVICHQILEHVVDDSAAMRELHRVVRPSWRVLLTTPVVAKWKNSLVDIGKSDAKTRDLLFGQSDHLRYYGADFKDSLQRVGFEIDEYIAQEPDVSQYSLVRGETIYVATKSDPSLRPHWRFFLAIEVDIAIIAANNPDIPGISSEKSTEACMATRASELMPIAT